MSNKGTYTVRLSEDDLSFLESISDQDINMTLEIMINELINKVEES